MNLGEAYIKIRAQTGPMKSDLANAEPVLQGQLSSMAQNASRAGSRIGKMLVQGLKASLPEIGKSLSNVTAALPRQAAPMQRGAGGKFLPRDAETQGARITRVFRKAHAEASGLFSKIPFKLDLGAFGEGLRAARGQVDQLAASGRGTGRDAKGRFLPRDKQGTGRDDRGRFIKGESGPVNTAGPQKAVSGMFSAMLHDAGLVGGRIGGLLVNGLNASLPAIGRLPSVANSAFGQMSGAAVAAFAGVRAGSSRLLPDLSGVASATVNAFRDQFSRLGNLPGLDALVSGARSRLAQIQGMAGSVLKPLKDATDSLSFRPLVAAASNAFGQVRAAAASGMAGVKSAVAATINSLGEQFARLGQAAGKIPGAARALDTLKTAAGGVGQVLTKIPLPDFGAMASKISPVMSVLQSVGRGVAGLFSGLQLPKILLSAVASGLQGLVGVVGRAVSGVGSALSSGLRMAGMVAGRVLMVGLGTGAVAAIGAVTAGVGLVVAAVAASVWMVSKGIGAVWNVVSSIGSGVISTIGSVLGGLKAAIGGVFEGIKATLTGIVSSIASAIASAAGKVKEFLSSLAGEMVSSNAELEKFTTSLEVMLKSRSIADSFISDVRKMAAATPFEVPGLISASQQLLGVGVSVKEVLPMLTKLGDAASGSTVGMSALPRITRAISQMMGRGKVGGQDMMQITELGIPAWALLAKQMGKTTAEVQAMSEAGQLGPKEVLTLVDALGAAFPDMMKKQSQTYEGLGSTLKDTMGNIKQQLGEGYFAMQKFMLLGKIKFLESAPVQRFVESLSAGMKTASDAIIAKSEAIKASFNAWMNSPAGIVILSTLKEIGGLAIEVGRNLMDLVGGAIDSLAGRWGGFGGSVSGTLKSMLDGLRNVMNEVSVLTTSWSGFMDYAKAYAALKFLEIKDLVNTTWSESLLEARAKWASFVAELKSMMQVVVSSMGAIAKVLAIAVGVPVGALTLALGELAAAGGSSFEKVQAAAKEAGDRAYQSTKARGQDEGGKIKEGLTKDIEAARKAADDIWNKIKGERDQKRQGRQAADDDLLDKQLADALAARKPKPPEATDESKKEGADKDADKDTGKKERAAPKFSGIAEFAKGIQQDLKGKDQKKLEENTKNTAKNTEKATKELEIMNKNLMRPPPPAAFS